MIFVACYFPVTNIILAVEATNPSPLLPKNLPRLLGGDRVT
jgi:hypothetical protein